MSINKIIIRKLWAASGGFCANPNCHNSLFPFFEDGTIINIEELAHIIGKRVAGPRGKSTLSSSQRDEFDNIVLLCPNCHSQIDKFPTLYSTNMLQEWKKNHEECIKNLFKAQSFRSKKDMKEFLIPLVEENKSIFTNYGPYSKNAKIDPRATELEWERLSIQKIVHNNRLIEATIDANIGLLTQEEIKIFSKFKIHREGFEFNRLSGDVNPSVMKFPKDFKKLIE